MAKKKATQRRAKQPKERPARFTAKQGQYLAYLCLYRKLHRHSPSESEVAQYSGVSPPSAHQMILKLEKNGLITRKPGVPRSVRVMVPRDEIPPLDDDEEDAAVAASQVEAGLARLYSLQIFLIGGPISEKFLKRNREISRTIQIRGDQTLEDLHHATFDAFDRWDEHMYEFQFGKGPNDPKGPRYVLPHASDRSERNIAGDVEQAMIDSLGLKVDQAFGYWFDFGDDWWHQINVVAVEEKALKGKFPKVIKRVGKSPPQYMDEEE